MEIILEYLRGREAKGETLTASLPVISGSYGRTVGKAIGPWRMAALVRRVLPKELNARPYVLRCYFDCALLAARVHTRLQSFYMGHKGDIEATYTTKKHLPDTIIQAMREAFQPAEKYLTAMKAIDLEGQRKSDFLKLAELIGAFTPEELETLSIKMRSGNS